MVKFEAALPLRGDESNRLQHGEMLGDRLPGEIEVMLHRQTNADLVERLTIAIAQLVENRPPCRRN